MLSKRIDFPKLICFNTAFLCHITIGKSDGVIYQKGKSSLEVGKKMSSRFKFPRQLQRDLQKLKILTVMSLQIREVQIPYVVSHQTRYQARYTRNATSFVTPSHHLSLYKKPLYKGVLYYDHLTDHLRNQPIVIFKPALTKWLL